MNKTFAGKLSIGRLRKTHTHKRTTTNETTLIHINQSVCNRNLPILNFPANVLFINHRV